MTVLTFCSRCDQLVERGHRHRVKDRRPSARRRGYGKAHQRDRAAYLRVHPLCEYEGGCISPATDLDHIDGNPENRSWSNYRALCHSHHSQRTARDQPGGWAA